MTAIYFKLCCLCTQLPHNNPMVLNNLSNSVLLQKSINTSHQEVMVLVSLKEIKDNQIFLNKQQANYAVA